MDAFYASVEEREQPAFKGKPLAVGGSPTGRGVVAAANYAARAFGVRSAMPTATALRLCPELIVVQPRGWLYRALSNQLRNIFERYTPIIEPLSLDEAFLDVHGSEKLYGDVEQIGWRIKTAIKKELDLIASVGVAPNKFLAKLASDQDKPDGFTVIKATAAQAFLDPLPVGRISGVGKAAQAKLHQANIYTIKDLRQTSAQYLQQTFGKLGHRFWELCHGLDNRKVIADSEAKSISREATFDIDIEDLSAVESIALELTESVCFRLRNAGLKARTINLKVRYHDFSTITRSKSRDKLTDSTLEIWQCLSAMMGLLLANQQFAVRLIGVGLSNFGDAPATSRQADLFAVINDATEKHTSSKEQRIDKLADAIRRKYGGAAIRRGKSL